MSHIQVWQDVMAAMRRHQTPYHLRYPLEPGITYGDHGRWLRQRLPKMNPLCTRRVILSLQYFETVQYTSMHSWKVYLQENILFYPVLRKSEVKIISHFVISFSAAAHTIPFYQYLYSERGLPKGGHLQDSYQQPGPRWAARTACGKPP